MSHGYPLVKLAEAVHIYPLDASPNRLIVWNLPQLKAKDGRFALQVRLHPPVRSTEVDLEECQSDESPDAVFDRRAPPAPIAD